MLTNRSIQQRHFAFVEPSGETLVFHKEDFQVGLTFIIYKVNFFIRLAGVFNKIPQPTVMLGKASVPHFIDFQIGLALILYYIDLHFRPTGIICRKDLLSEK